ncbi:MAG TPA: adenylate/guanylate cyclase domain-containing protein [Steroidobacteraceae bacterium]|nr:adenylate/guanylate cyclase domain-containing protein [Steroidobacteraceae bacterium]
MNDSRGPRLRPTGSLLVTRVRASQIRTAYVTVLFADLRGYTGMVERLPAARVVPLLDEFFGVLGAAAKKFGGEVYHMAGDGIMAGFGVNAENGNGAAEALAAGHDMLKGFAPLADRWRRELRIDAGIGIGLHLGEVAFGVLGPPKRKTMTLVGDTVNVAARLCSRARAGEVLFSCTVAAALRISTDTQGGEASTSFLQLPQFELRGRRGPIDIWCVPAPERLAI